MKTRLLLPVLLVALSSISSFGQPQPSQPLPYAAPIAFGGVRLPPQTPKLTTFSLDFPGGTPQQLVTAIEKAMGKPLNAIIAAEDADFKLPPLKMNNVDVAQLFGALEATSRKTTVTYGPPGTVGWNQSFTTSYGFRTPNQNSVSDDSIWYFYVEKPLVPPPQNPYVAPKVCRFYPLTAYLERGLTVEDITTAITTGWELLGESPSFVPKVPLTNQTDVTGTMPTLRFHKETKLLIAVGDPGKLETVDAVLKALQAAPPTLPAPTTAPPPKPAGKPKTEN